MDTLPIEIIKIILDLVYCPDLLRFVCRAWRDLYPGRETIASKFPCTLNILQWLHSRYCLIDSQQVTFITLQDGNIEVLDWLLQEDLLRTEGTYPFTLALELGNVSSLLWLQEHFSDLVSSLTPLYIIQTLARFGHDQALVEYVDKYTLSSEDQQRVCSIAAAHGQLSTLQYIRSIGYSWNSDVLLYASAYDYNELLYWAVSNGCPKSESYSLEKISYRIPESALPTKPRTLKQLGRFPLVRLTNIKAMLAKYDSWEKISDLEVEKIIILAAKQGMYQVVKWAIVNGATWSLEVVKTFITEHNINMVRWSLDHGYPISDDLCLWAVVSNDLKILELVCSRGAPLSDELCQAAIMFDCREILKWLLEHGCSWHENMFYAAIAYGRTDILSWAHSRGYHWDRAFARSICTTENTRAWLEEHASLERT
jgi:hypothetical protein